MISLSDITKEAIKAHTIRDFPRECCGYVVVLKGKEVVIPCANVHSNPSEFVKVSAEDQHRIESEYDVIAFYHSHPNASARFTDADQASSEAMDIPWVVYAYPLDQWNTYIPSGWVAPLVGRKFVFGVHDCYSICRDYYKQELNLELPDFDREDNWWRKGQNLYLDNFEKAGFVRTSDLRKHDVFLMQIASPVPNHAAVYLGQNIMLHHVYGRLSTRQPYGGFWLKNTYCVIRHKSLC